jgi:heme exporter protein A
VNPAAETGARSPQFAATALACRRSERVVFAGLDFSLSPGGALLLTGPNGSGKSSLLRVMAGLIKPFAGILQWEDAPVSRDPARHREAVAYLGHHDGLKPMLTAAENIRFWAGLRGRADQTESALAALDLTALSNTQVRFLSAGQRRRTALARVIAGGAPLWLLDEPTVGLDTAAIAALEAALAAHRAAGGMVAAATHTLIVLPGAASLDLADYAAPNLLDSNLLDDEAA